jgi:hypothetical protein
VIDQKEQRPRGRKGNKNDQSLQHSFLHGDLCTRVAPSFHQDDVIDVVHGVSHNDDVSTSSTSSFTTTTCVFSLFTKRTAKRTNSLHVLLPPCEEVTRSVPFLQKLSRFTAARNEEQEDEDEDDGRMGRRRNNKMSVAKQLVHATRVTYHGSSQIFRRWFLEKSS